MAATEMQVREKASPLKAKSSSDDKLMRLFILVIGAYLVVALANH